MMMRPRITLALAAGLLGLAQLTAPLQARADDALIRDFCYTLQVGLLCDNLRTHAQTESRIERHLGSGLRQTPACRDGLAAAFDDEEAHPSGFCDAAWQHFGCNGRERQGLLMENPFRISDPILCEFHP